MKSNRETTTETRELGQHFTRVDWSRVLDAYVAYEEALTRISDDVRARIGWPRRESSSYEQVGWCDSEGPYAPPIVQPLSAPRMGYKRREPLYRKTPGAGPHYASDPECSCGCQSL